LILMMGATLASEPRLKRGPNKARSLAVLAVCEVLGMSLWFSASAVLPTLKAQYAISGTPGGRSFQQCSARIRRGNAAQRGSGARRPD
jgi:hypothetical protein